MWRRKEVTVDGTGVARSAEAVNALEDQIAVSFPERLATAEEQGARRCEPTSGCSVEAEGAKRCGDACFAGQ